MKAFYIRYYKIDWQTRSIIVLADSIEQAIAEASRAGFLTQNDVCVWYDVTAKETRVTPYKIIGLA